jgi:hypothetical protein
MEILKLQHKSTLAKLLAKENITVIHDPIADTASFDVVNRNLVLPAWKDMGIMVYDMLIAHEVGHALYTLKDDVEQFEKDHGTKHFQLLNVIEDVRIERLVQNLYPSLPRIFHTAYKELVDSDFFNLGNKANINKMSFPNRLNLHAKIGNHVDIPLNNEEMDLYNECYSAETWDDVIRVYHKILKFISQNKKKNEQPDPQGSLFDPSASIDTPDFYDDSDTDESDAGDSNTNTGDSDADLEENGGEDFGTEDFGNNNSGGEDSDNEICDKEDTAIDDSFEKNLIDKSASFKNRGVVPVVFQSNENLLKYVVPYKEYFSKYVKNTQEPHFNPYTSQISTSGMLIKKRTRKKGTILARAFERKRAAYEYARGKESKTGTLNPNRLYSYKIKDDIFNSVFEKYDAKSHGMIFFIDFSASMHNQFYHMLEHTLNLVHFCKMAGIPFRVFSFTTINFEERQYDDSSNDNMFNLTNTRIVEHFSSKMSKQVYEMAYDRFCMAIADRFEVGCSEGLLGTPADYMGGTPTQNVLVIAHALIDEFRKAHRVQKLNTIVLTDGDSSPAKTSRYCAEHYLVSIKNKTYEIPRSAHLRTAKFVEMLADAKNVNTIGYYLPNNRRYLNQQLKYLSSIKGKDIFKIKKEMHKNNVVESQNYLGYNQHFILPVDVKVHNDDFDYCDSPNESIKSSAREQGKLARHFSAHIQKNNKSKILLEQFAQAIS